MNTAQVHDILHQAMIVLLKVSGPVLAVGLVVGVIVSLLQALTQIQEATLSFVPKILAICMSLLIFAPFMVDTLTYFSQDLYQKITEVN